MRVVDELLDQCLGLLEAGDPPAHFPDPHEYLRGRDIEPPAPSTLMLRHTVGPIGAEPMMPVCPDGSRNCYPRCREIKGQQVCTWICDCPG
jgi:hypothetical protein